MGTGHLVSDLAAAPETVAGRLTRARKGLGCVSHRAGLRGCGPLVSEDLMTLPPVISERFAGVNRVPDSYFHSGVNGYTLPSPDWLAHADFINGPSSSALARCNEC